MRHANTQQNKIPPPVITSDTNGIITSVNSSFEKEFQWPAAKLIGQPLTRIIPKNIHDAHNLGFSRYMMSGKATLLDTPLDLMIETGTGQTIAARHLISLKEKNGQAYFSAEIIPCPRSEKK